MTFHESTVKKLRLALAGHLDHLSEANGRVERRQYQLAEAQEELGYAEEKAAVLAANVADCQRWLDFAELCDADEDLAYAFANAVLNRASKAGDEAAARENAEHNPRTCTECTDQHETEQAGAEPLGSTWADPEVRRAVRETIAADEDGQF